MPSRVYFAGSAGDSPLSLRVSEDIEEIAKLLSGATPFKLTHKHDGRQIYVVPGSVAYWIDSPEKPQRTRGDRT